MNKNFPFSLLPCSLERFISVSDAHTRTEGASPLTTNIFPDMKKMSFPPSHQEENALTSVLLRREGEEGDKGISCLGFGLSADFVGFFPDVAHKSTLVKTYKRGRFSSAQTPAYTRILYGKKVMPFFGQQQWNEARKNWKRCWPNGWLLTFFTLSFRGANNKTASDRTEKIPLLLSSNFSFPRISRGGGWSIPILPHHTPSSFPSSQRSTICQHPKNPAWHH